MTDLSREDIERIRDAADAATRPMYNGSRTRTTWTGEERTSPSPTVEYLKARLHFRRITTPEAIRDLADAALAHEANCPDHHIHEGTLCGCLCHFGEAEFCACSPEECRPTPPEPKTSSELGLHRTSSEAEYPRDDMRHPDPLLNLKEPTDPDLSADHHAGAHYNGQPGGCPLCPADLAEPDRCEEGYCDTPEHWDDELHVGAGPARVWDEESLRKMYARLAAEYDTMAKVPCSCGKHK